MALTLPTDPLSARFSSLGDLVSKVLPIIYTAAGLVLLVTLVSGGITLMTAAGDAGKIKSGYGRLTAGLIGFLLIFVSYFVAQVVEVVLGVKIL